MNATPQARLELLERLGVYIEPEFLSMADCRGLLAAVAAAPVTPGTVIRDGHAVVDHEVKRLMQVFLKDALAADLSQRLDAAVARVAQHFRTSLLGHEGVNVYCYAPGDAYAPHRDWYGDDDAATFGHHRQASIVLFLNDPAGLAGAPYTGGDLVLYDVMGEGPLGQYGIPIPASAGLLVAFRPHLLHEVTPVTGGRRFVAVSRFF
jgi:predicted 2-oxoglutarate/Fe(II)-dependent dioxygenase YbiX